MYEESDNKGSLSQDGMYPMTDQNDTKKVVFVLERVCNKES